MKTKGNSRVKKGDIVVTKKAYYDYKKTGKKIEDKYFHRVVSLLRSRRKMYIRPANKTDDSIQLVWCDNFVRWMDVINEQGSADKKAVNTISHNLTHREESNYPIPEAPGYYDSDGHRHAVGFTPHAYTSQEPREQFQPEIKFEPQINLQFDPKRTIKMTEKLVIHNWFQGLITGVAVTLLGLVLGFLIYIYF